MPDDSTVPQTATISTNLNANNNVPRFHQRGHHRDALITGVRCLCGGAVYGYEQPALVPTGNATTHVHCVNEACAWYMRTLELPNWIELVWGGVDARLRESGAA